MDEFQPDGTPSDVTETEDRAVTMRGLGVALTARSLRALLDPATRAEAEVVVDLSRLLIEVPAAAVAEIVARVAPELGVDLDEDAMTVRLAGAPAIRCLAPSTGVRVRLGSAGLTIGEPDGP